MTIHDRSPARRLASPGRPAGQPDAGRTRVLTTVPDVANVPLARRFARTALAGHHLDRSVVEDLELVVSELVTNAIEHGTGTTLTVHVCIELIEDADAAAGPLAEVTISVTSAGNTSALSPVAAWELAGIGSVTGRGLGIVRALVDHVELDRDASCATITVRRSAPRCR